MSSYITELKINGQIRTLNFNNYGREALARFYGKDALSITQELSRSWNESLLILAADCVYWGLVGDYRVNRRTVDFTIQDVTKWLEQADDNELAPAIKVFLDSVKDRVIVAVSEAAKEEAKDEANVSADESEEKKISAGRS